MPDAAPADWWQTVYNDIVADLLLVRKDGDELRATIRFLLDAADLSPGDRVLDQGCGIGSLSLPLARAGLRVIGIDQAETYIARANAQRESASCEYYVADALSYRANPPVDVVLNWNTSFGNADEARNREMLLRAFESLRPEGRIVLDYQHVARVMHQFRGAFVQRLLDDRGETLLLRESELDLAEGSLRQRWTIVLPEGRTSVRHTAIRLYLPHDLAAMLTGVGFTEVRFFGGVRGEALAIDSPRCILIARRPGP